MHLGRLAYDHPGWTPAISTAATLRTPASLAPGPAAIATVLAAAHHAADAILQTVPPDQDALIDTAARRRLFARTRLLPERDDIPYRYGRIPPAQLENILTAYTTATRATQHTVTSLDHLATTLDTPTRHLPATRPRHPAAIARADNPRHTSQPPGQWSPATLLPESGRLEQALRALQTTEPAMLTQAAALDSAAQHLIDQATAKTHRRSIAKNARPAPGPGHRVPRHPPEAAGTDSADTRSPRQPPGPGARPDATVLPGLRAATRDADFDTRRRSHSP